MPFTQVQFQQVSERQQRLLQRVAECQVVLTFSAKAWGFHFDSLLKIVEFIDGQVAAASSVARG